MPKSREMVLSSRGSSARNVGLERRHGEVVRELFVKEP
jgi:hypothetical protein